jgi:hypothetical protein
MKKVFLISFVAILALTSCSGGASTEATSTDSTTVADSTSKVDSTGSLLSDSTHVSVDSTECSDKCSD